MTDEIDDQLTLGTEACDLVETPPPGFALCGRCQTSVMVQHFKKHTEKLCRSKNKVLDEPLVECIFCPMHLVPVTEKDYHEKYLCDWRDKPKWVFGNDAQTNMNPLDLVQNDMENLRLSNLASPSSGPSKPVQPVSPTLSVESGPGLPKGRGRGIPSVQPTVRQVGELAAQKGKGRGRGKQFYLTKQNKCDP